jgi:transposase
MEGRLSNSMDMDQKTKIVLAWELHEQGISNSQIAQRLEANRDTINGWIRDITDQGLFPFLENRHQGKRRPRPSRQVSLLVKQKVWQLREREINCCGQKIAYFLANEQGIELSVPKIYEILAERYVIRSKWKKNKARGPMAQWPNASGPGISGGR